MQSLDCVSKNLKCSCFEMVSMYSEAEGRLRHDGSAGGSP